MIEMLSNPFIQISFIAGLLASFASGVVGSYVVIKRIVFISGSIAHSVLGGMGLFLYLSRKFDIPWLTPLLGAFAASILSAIIIGYIHLHFKERRDAIIASVWSTGMAIGVIFISITPGYNTEIMNFLFGNILWTTRADLLALFLLDLALLFSVGIFYSRFLAIAFDEELAKLKGLNVKPLYFFLLILIAISIVLLIQVIGVILVIALLSLPAMVSSLFTKKLLNMMVLSVFVAMVFNSLGIALSYHFNWPTGATIALVAAILYLTLLPFKKRFHRKTPH